MFKLDVCQFLEFWMTLLRMIVLYLKMAHGNILEQFFITPPIRFGHWKIKKCHFIMEKCHIIIRLHRNSTWMHSMPCKTLILQALIPDGIPLDSWIGRMASVWRRSKHPVASFGAMIIGAFRMILLYSIVIRTDSIASCELFFFTAPYDCDIIVLQLLYHDVVVH